MWRARPALDGAVDTGVGSGLVFHILEGIPQGESVARVLRASMRTAEPAVGGYPAGPPLPQRRRGGGGGRIVEGVTRRSSDWDEK